MRLKKLLRIKNKSGFTLVEVVISLAITAVLIAAMTMLFTPFRQMIYEQNRDSFTDMVVQNLCEYVQKKTHTASKIRITNDFNDYLQLDSSGTVGVKCLVITSDGHADGQRRLYDFTASKITAVPAISNTYNVFNEEYYCNNDYEFLFLSSGNGNFKWLEITLNAYKTNGSLATAVKTHKYKFLIENINESISPPLDIVSVSLDIDRTIYIMYA